MNLLQVAWSTGCGDLAALLFKHTFEAVVESFALSIICPIQHTYVPALALADREQVCLFPFSRFRDKQLVNLKEIHQKKLVCFLLKQL